MYHSAEIASPLFGQVLPEIAVEINYFTNAHLLNQIIRKKAHLIII
jgi:hypothetical protein